MGAGEFAAIALAFYVGHHVGDYWVQRDEDAKHKGDAGLAGRMHCVRHVASYLITQLLCLGVVLVTFGIEISFGAVYVGLTVSGAFHYAIDRREHGIMFWLARRMPGKANFLKLGAPRAGIRIDVYGDCYSCKGTGIGGDENSNGRCYDCHGAGQTPIEPVGDNPTLGTGAWALDQSAHLLTSVFLAALVMAWLS